MSEHLQKPGHYRAPDLATLIASAKEGDATALTVMEQRYLAQGLALVRQKLPTLKPAQALEIAAQSLRKAIRMFNLQALSPSSFGTYVVMYAEALCEEHLKKPNLPQSQPNHPSVKDSKRERHDNQDEKPVNPLGTHVRVRRGEFLEHQIDMDAPISEDGDESHGDLMGDTRFSPDRLLQQKLIQELWEEVLALADLTELEEAVLSYRHGLRGYPRLLLKEIAVMPELFGEQSVPIHTVRLTELKALKKLERAAKKLREQGVTPPEEL